MAAIAAGAVAAIVAERSTMRLGIDQLHGVQPLLVLAAIAAECASMAAFALLQARLLRSAGARLRVSWLLSTAYTANAIAVAVPVVGAGMATGYTYRQVREQGADPVSAGAALTLGGVVSTVSFMFVVALGAILSGNPAAAAGGLTVGVAALAAVIYAVVELSSTAGRHRLVRIIGRVLSATSRLVRRPRGDPHQVAEVAIGRVSALRLTGAALAVSLCWGVLNWLADAVCFALALAAVGAHIPWSRVLLIWSAGAGAASFSPTPGGLGVVDVALIAGLAASGARAPQAVAAVLLYRIVAFKFVITTGWVIRRSWARRVTARSGG